MTKRFTLVAANENDSIALMKAAGLKSGYDPQAIEDALKNWRLISDRTGRDLFPGDEVDIARPGWASEVVVITGFAPPHKPGASGRVHVYYKDLGASSYGTYYASVLHAHYVKVQ